MSKDRINLKAIMEMSEHSITTLQKITPVFNSRDPVNLYLDDLQERSKETQYKNIRQFAIFFLQNLNAQPENIPWSDVSYIDVKNYLRFLKERNHLRDKTKKLNPNTINGYLIAIRSVMKKAYKIRCVDESKKVTRETYDEISEIKMLKGSRIADGRCLSDSEIIAFLSSCKKGTPADMRDKAIFCVMADSGLRISECSTLSFPGNIDFGEGCIRVVGKGNKERKIPMTEVLEDVLIDYIENLRGEDAGALFYRIRSNREVDNTNPITVSGIRHILQKRGVFSDIDSFKPHDLRRSFITRLLESGVDVLTTQKLAGHSSPDTTSRYDKRGDKAKRAAIDKINLKDKL